jgi:threonine/homoserine/homoserine lactone efflux protein
VLQTLEGLGTAIRVAGAAYLIYAGGRLLKAAWRRGASPVASGTPRSASGAFRHGLLTNLANPKALALFGSLFAVLVPPGAPAWFNAGLLLTVVLTTACWYVLVAVAMSSGAIAHGYRRAERGITAITGTVFVAAGARLATER